jgi:hypothetical protein
MMRLLPIIAASALSLFVHPRVDGAVAPGKQVDVAAVITKADAEAALGEVVKEPQPRNGDGTDGYYSRCNYYSEKPGKSLVLRVHQAAAGKLDAKKQFEMLSGGHGKIESISGLGDRAGYIKGNGQATGPDEKVMMVYVAKGNALITIGIAGLDDEMMALNKAKEIAKKILTQL